MDSSTDESKRLSIKVWILSCLFGIGSWVVMNGLWVELPNLVNQLPEGWKLPSYLTIIVQIANIGPISYGLLKKYCVKPERKETLEHITICLILVFGIIGAILLACYWKKTSNIFGAEHSTSLLLLTFVIALVDCTSSVTFLPFMSLLPAFYMSPFYVGENMSSLVAAIFGLAQGVEVYNGTLPNGQGRELLTPARYSQSTFFLILGVLMILCFASYLILRLFPSIKRLHINSDEVQVSTHYDRFHTSVSSEFQGDSSDNYLVIGDTGHDRKLIQVCFCCMTWLNVLQNGVMASVGSYAYGPYGELSYHFASTLGPIVASISCFLFMFFPRKSIHYVIGGSVGYTLAVIYLLIMATLSPYPLLYDKTFGKILIVVVCMVASSLVAYTKLAIASVMRDFGHQYLFYTGITMQLGSFIGAVVMFPIVNYTKVFKS